MRSQLETSLGPTFALPHLMSSLPCSLSRWLSLTPHTPWGTQKIPDWSRARGRRDPDIPAWGPELLSQPHSWESRQLASPLNHKDTSGRAQYGD